MLGRKNKKFSTIVGAVVGALCLFVAKNGLCASCPRDMVLAGDVCVDKFEGSLVEMREDGTEAPFTPYASPIGHRVRAVSQAGVAPQAHISMVEARRACTASGKRLCRAKEWKTACKGPERTRYPYGNTFEPNACVDTERTSPILKKYAGEHTARTMNDPTLNQEANTVEPTGAAASCTNGYGVHDMVGNVHEWTDDGTFRGGYYLDTKINGEGCEYVTSAHSPVYYDYSTGFRCCADAGDYADEPTAPEAAPAPAAAPVPPSTTRPLAPHEDRSRASAWSPSAALSSNGGGSRRRSPRKNTTHAKR